MKYSFKIVAIVNLVAFYMLDGIRGIIFGIFCFALGYFLAKWKN